MWVSLEKGTADALHIMALLEIRLFNIGMTSL